MRASANLGVDIKIEYWAIAPAGEDFDEFIRRLAPKYLILQVDREARKIMIGDVE